jgi:integrase
MAKHEKYQTLTPSGIRAQIRIRGVLHRRHFKRGTDPFKIRKWILGVQAKHRRPDASQTGRFSEDAQAYLAAVTAMPTYAQREAHIKAWIAEFGTRQRDGIAANEIRLTLHKWKQDGKAAATVNKLRTALMHLYTVLDGKSAQNPVRDVPRFQEPAPAPRGLPYAVLKKLLKAVPHPKSRARLMVIAYTGLPPASVRTIRIEDIDLKAGTVAVPGRKKGAGTKGRIVPLTPDGKRAMKAMIQSQAFGEFTRAPLGRILKAALADVGLPTTVRVYDLRHSFASEVYRRSGDIRATQLLLDHSTPNLTHRYTVTAQEPRVQAAIAKFK